MCPCTIVSLAEHMDRRPTRSRSDPLARFAFDMCERTFLARDWQEFDYWFRVAKSQRRSDTSAAADPRSPTGLPR